VRLCNKLSFLQFGPKLVDAEILIRESTRK